MHQNESEVVTNKGIPTCKAEKRPMPPTDTSLLAPKKKFLQDYRDNDDPDTRKKSHEFMEAFLQKKIYVDGTVMGFYDRNNPDSRNMSPATKYHWNRMGTMDPESRNTSPATKHHWNRMLTADPDSQNTSPTTKHHWNRMGTIDLDNRNTTPDTKNHRNMMEAVDLATHIVQVAPLPQCKDELPLNLSVKTRPTTSSDVKADKVHPHYDCSSQIPRTADIKSLPCSDCSVRHTTIWSRPSADATQRRSSGIVSQLLRSETSVDTGGSAFHLYQHPTTPAVQKKGHVESIETEGQLERLPNRKRSSDDSEPRTSDKQGQPKLLEIHSPEPMEDPAVGREEAGLPAWHAAKRRWSFDSSDALRSALALKNLPALSCSTCDNSVLDWFKCLKESWDDIPLMRSCYCLTCHVTFSNAEALTEHRLATHSDPHSFSIEYRCMFCPRTFRDSVGFSQHTKRHEKENIFDVLSTSATTRD